MRKITYRDYFDKVYGCMIGKCVSGTAGAPYEGMKQQLDLRFSAEEADTTLPNDDLDLQVLWLEVLERKGISFTSDDLADIFLECCPYCPGEYAVFKKNYRRGIHPPYSGNYNNRYYLEGMGCPIRSEIWGCIAPGDPGLAAELAAMDGILDHGDNSVWGECFFAALEAEAFFESDIRKLINKGLQYIPEDSRMYQLIRDVVDWCDELEEYEQIWNRILRKYGHPDCTNVFQNIGIIIYTLLKGEGDLIKTTELAVNAGYDTDCTGATVGAILGLIEGAARLEQKYGFSDQTFSLGVTAQRRSNKISDLAEDICRAGIYFNEKKSADVQIEESPLSPLLPPEEEQPSVTVRVKYEGRPVVGPEHPGKAVLIIQNHTAGSIAGELTLRSDTLIPEWESSEMILEPETGREIPVTFTLPENCREISDRNLVHAEFKGETAVTYDFGFAGAVAWHVYGPYWKNAFHVEKLTKDESYMDQFPGNTKEEKINLIRDYHLNAFADNEGGHQDLQKLSVGECGDDCDIVYTYEDRIAMSDLIDYSGPCTLYLHRSFYSPEERECRLYVGYSDAFCLWLNGEKLAERDDMGWWTGENVHLNNVHVKKGVNHLAVRISRRSLESCYNFTFLKNEEAALGLLSFPEQIMDFINLY